jgi:cation-transporting ATPase E
MGLFVFYGSLVLAGATTDATLDAARTALTAFLVFVGLLLVVFVEPPVAWFAVAEPLTSDRRPTWLAALLAIGFVAVLFVPAARAFFSFSVPAPRDAAIVIVAVVAWLLLVRTFWERRVVDRFLGI